MDTMESTHFIFDVNNSKKSLTPTKENLKSISSYCVFEDVVYRQQMQRSREDPFYGLTPLEMKQKYKFFLHTVMDLCGLVGNDFEKATERSYPLTVKQQVCPALYYFTSGILL